MRKVFVEPVVLPEPRFRDGLGIRYVRTDGTDDPVEVLRPLWDVGAMQNAIRQRVNRLATFRQARFVPIRAAEVPRDDGSTIEVVSDYVSGHRLSQYLEAAQTGVVSVETSTAIYILRELLGALALLHESRGVTHGAVGPERILITPKGRVVVADYVLGPAIERLEFTRPRLWREFRIPLPAGKGTAKLDDKADVLQVGVTALALLLGRPLDLAEYPDRVDALVASLSQIHPASGRPPLPAALIAWLRRALLRDPNGRFANVSDARLTLEGVLSGQDTATGGAAALKSMAEIFGRYAADMEAKAAAEAAEVARRAALAAEAAVREALQEQAADAAAAAPLSELVPAFTLLSDSQGSSPDGIARATAPASGSEADPPVGWRVPEPPAIEETLPTSPLLQIDAAASEPATEDFIEEVLDLSAIAGPDDADPTAVETAHAPGGVAIPPDVDSETPAAVLANAIDGESVEVVDLRDLATAEPAPEHLETMPGVVVDVAPAEQDAIACEEAAIETVDDGPAEQDAIACEEAAIETVDDGPAEQDAIACEEAAIATVDVAPAEQEAIACEEAAIETVDVAPSALEGVDVAAAPTFEAAPPAAPEGDAGEAPEAIDLTVETVATVTSVEAALAELTAMEAPSPTPIPEALPEWRLLADPVGATAPTIDVEEPTESLEDLVAEFAATRPIDEALAAVRETPDRMAAEPAALIEDAGQVLAPAPSVEQPVAEVMEPPAAMVEARNPLTEAGEAPPATTVPSVIDEILGLRESQAAAQAAVEAAPEAAAAAPDIAAWSFVEELLHHDERFVAPSEAEVESPQAVVEASKPAMAAAPVAENEAADAPAPALEDTEPALPPDWLIEVGSRPAAQPSVLISRVELDEVPDAAAEPVAPAPAVERPPCVETVFAESIAPPPVVRRPAPDVLDDDQTGPVFPRVAPSVRRVRAEARRRRLARISHSAVGAVQLILGACASGARAIGGGISQSISAAGRGLASAVRAVLAIGVLVAMALSRGISGVGRAAAAGAAAAAGGAAVVVRTAAAALAGLSRAVGAGIRSAGSGAGRALFAGASALTAAAALAARTAATVTQASGRGCSTAARALAAGLGTLLRAGRAGITVALRGTGRAARVGANGTLAIARWASSGLTGLVRVTGRASANAVSIGAAAAGIAGRGAVATGAGVGRAALTIPRKLYFLASDVADRLPRPLFRPWYLAAALVVIVAVAGVPYARARLFTEKPVVGTIRVESARPDAMVTIDGVPHGRAPLTASVPVGRHRIEVAIGGQTRTHEIDVSSGRETLVQAAAADLKGMGAIRVTTDPAGAEVLIDGVLHGRAPVTVENVAEGAHTILVRDGDASVRQSVRVREDETLDATIQLRPGWLAVFAPVKLEVLENGRPIGSTEGGRILTPPGPHTIEVVSQAMGFRETRQVEIKPGAVAAVTIAMPPATIEVVAPAEAEILIDGRSVGTAPLGPLQVAVGTREIVMRHPALGERRQVVSVTYNAPVRVVFE